MDCLPSLLSPHCNDDISEPFDAVYDDHERWRALSATLSDDEELQRVNAPHSNYQAGRSTSALCEFRCLDVGVSLGLFELM